MSADVTLQQRLVRSFLIVFAVLGVAAVALLPVGLVAGGTSLLSPSLLLQGAGVALLGTVLPFTLEFEALKRLPPYATALGEVVDPSTIEGMMRASRSGDPAQRALAAKQVRDAVAARLAQLTQQRAAIEARAKALKAQH